MKKITFYLLIAAISFATSSKAENSLDKEEHLLDGMSFTFQYQNAGAMDVSFANGELTYKWIVGRNAKEPKKTYAYRSRKIASEIYLVNWHELDSKNYVTMVYNFGSYTCTVSVISKYASDKPFTGLQAGVMQHVTTQ